MPQDPPEYLSKCHPCGEPEALDFGCAEGSNIHLIAIWLIGIWFPNVVFTFVNNAIHPRSAFAKSLSGFAPTLLATTLIIVQTYALVLFYIGFMAQYRNKNNTWLFWAASLFGLLGLIGLMLGFFGIMEMWANVLSPPPSSNGWGSSGWK
jgi:hypothetical protein